MCLEEYIMNYLKVFISGGNGFIGCMLVCYFEVNGVDVCGVDLMFFKEFNIVVGNLNEFVGWCLLLNDCDLVIYIVVIVLNVFSYK